MNNKIGVGIITCNRQEFFKKCLDSIPSVGSLVVVNDGDAYAPSVYGGKPNEIIQHTSSKYVGISKNEAMRYLVQNDCDHIFIIEDDMYIKDPLVFEKYIKTAEETGIWHLNFGYHGPANKTPDGLPKPRQTVAYDNGINLALNLHIVGAFSYYYRGVIKNIGYIDEHFKNAFDHVEHTYRIIKAGLHTPFWWFADVADSHNLIGDQDTDLKNSTIRKNNEQWMANFKEAMAWYKHIHGWYPTQSPDTDPSVVLKRLEWLKQNYARKVL